jgi:hypothetical protein
MDKIEDIEMIGLVMVEQSKSINKIGIAALELGERAESARAPLWAGWATAAGIGDGTCVPARGPLDLVRAGRLPNDDLVWSNLKAGNLIPAGVPSR